VVAGSTIKFSWSTRNATRVTFFANAVSQGDQQPTNTSNSFLIVLQGQYQLTAANSAGVQTSSFIQIGIRSLPAPPAPTNVRGQSQGPTSVLIQWDYDPSYLSRITGFRVYSALAPSTHFVPVSGADPIDKSQLQWLDSRAQCGQAYYVTAVYTNYTDTGPVSTETAPSATRYYTLPCATPTPRP
jgi:hypothetical protein